MSQDCSMLFCSVKNNPASSFKKFKPKLWEAEEYKPGNEGRLNRESLLSSFLLFITLISC